MSNTKTEPTEIEAPAGAEDLMKEYALAEAALAQAKDAMKPLRAKLLALFPKDTVGDFVINAGKWELEVQFPESYAWNADEITAYFGAELPAFVKRNLSITETDFKRLSDEDRQHLAGARELKVGSPKISLIVNQAA